MTLAELRKIRTAARVVEEEDEEQGDIREEEQAPGSDPVSPIYPKGGQETNNQGEEDHPQGQGANSEQEQLGQSDAALSPQLLESEHAVGTPQVEIVESQPQQQFIPVGKGIEPSQIMPDISSSAPAEPSRGHTRVIVPYSRKWKGSKLIRKEAPKQPKILLEITLRVLRTHRKAKKEERKKKAQERAAQRLARRRRKGDWRRKQERKQKRKRRPRRSW